MTEQESWTLTLISGFEPVARRSSAVSVRTRLNKRTVSRNRPTEATSWLTPVMVRILEMVIHRELLPVHRMFRGTEAYS